jgi:hypothetical protein
VGLCRSYRTNKVILTWNVVVLDGWIEEVERQAKFFRIILIVTNSHRRHILPNTLNVHIYHGPKRESDPLRLLDFDIIFTTYATVAAEFRRCRNVIHSIH